MTLEDSPISCLKIQHGILTSLAENGYKTIGDIHQSSAQDLSIELRITLPQAEDIIRQVHIVQSSQHIGSRPSSPSNLDPPSSPSKTQKHTSTASALLSNPLPKFSTLSSSVDSLLSHFASTSSSSVSDYHTNEVVTNGESSSNGRKGKGKGKARDMGGGWLSPGMSLEISGPPGIGKTSLCVGIALSALSTACEGNGSDERESSRREGSRRIGGEILIVDTEGAISMDRLAKAAEALNRTNPDLQPTRLLEGIHLLRVSTQTQMMAFLNIMTEWVEDHPQVNLVIIDTLSYHFRQPSLDMNSRRRFMELVKQQVGKATSLHNCAVVITSQLATKLLTSGGKAANFDTGDRAVLMPQLGDQWTTAKTIRIVLFRGSYGDEYRYAHASTDSGYKDVPWASYDVDNDGLPCDIPDE